MISKEHYFLAFELKKKAEKLKNIDTTQLGFDLPTLKESDDLFHSYCKSGIDTFENYWIDELRSCYEPIVMLLGRGEWTELNKKHIKHFFYECLFGVYLSTVDSEGKIFTAASLKLTVSLLYDTENTFNRVYRLKIISELLDGDNIINIENNPATIFSKDYFAQQINEFAADLEEPSKGSFLISAINCITK